MAGRWEYNGHESWVPGKNMPALVKGGSQGGQSLNAAGLQLFGNCVESAGKLSPDLRKQLYIELSGRHTVATVDAVTVVSALGGVSSKTARSWFNILKARGWASAFTHSDRVLAVGGETPQVQVAVGTWDGAFEGELPDFVLPTSEALAVTDSEELNRYLESRPPECRPHGHLEQWREHPNFAIGMRVAELSTIWLAHGWQKDAFSMFTWWMSRIGPDVVGNLNHTKRWLTGFQASLIQACHVGIASSLHAVVPATGMPSLLSRVIDVVSINSQSLLPIIHIYTSSDGKLSWALLDCPCLAHIGSSQSSEGKGVAVERIATRRWFGFHSAEHMIKLVHRVEQSFHLTQPDRSYRLLVTVADQAIQGPGSIRFTEKERRGDGLAPDPLSEGVCKFHIADGVGTNNDKHYDEAIVFDRLCRLIRRHFGWGTGSLIFKGVATIQAVRSEFPRVGTKMPASSCAS